MLTAFSPQEIACCTKPRRTAMQRLRGTSQAVEETAGLSPAPPQPWRSHWREGKKRKHGTRVPYPKGHVCATLPGPARRFVVWRDSSAHRSAPASRPPPDPSGSRNPFRPTSAFHPGNGLPVFRRRPFTRWRRRSAAATPRIQRRYQTGVCTGDSAASIGGGKRGGDKFFVLGAADEEDLCEKLERIA